MNHLAQAVHHLVIGSGAADQDVLTQAERISLANLQTALDEAPEALAVWLEDVTDPAGLWMMPPVGSAATATEETSL